MEKKRPIGFGSGAVFRNMEMKDALSLYRSLNYKSVELSVIRLNQFQSGEVDKIGSEDLEGFDYVSLHAPAIKYGKNENTDYVFEKIGMINKLRKLDCVVFHPDLVQDFSVFNEIDFNVAFENLDNRKTSCQTPKELEKILSMNSKWGLVLDVNHIFTLDKTMQLAKAFHDALGSRLVQYHLSGYSTYHDPLYETKQEEIMGEIRNPNTPIIIESIVKPENLQDEMSYILEGLSKEKTTESPETPLL